MALPIEEEGGEDLDAQFEEMADTAFPEKEWDEEQLAAFKEAIRICLEKDKGGAYGAAPKKGGVDLAILMGPGKAKK